MHLETETMVKLTAGSKWVKGKFGDAIELDPTAFVLLQVSDSLHGDIFKADPFTISAWIKPNFEGTEWEHIWRSLPTASGHNTFFLNKNQGLLSWRGQVAGWTVLCQSEGGIVEKDKWMHVTRLRATAINSGFMRMASRSPRPTSRKPAGEQRHLSSWRLKVARLLPVRWTMYAVFTRALDEDEIGLILEGVETFLPVEPKGKLATQWADLKRSEATQQQ